MSTVKQMEMWEVISKNYLPNHIMLFRGGAGGYAYAVGQLRVIERHKETQESRERIIDTDPLYLHDNPDLATEFKIAQIGIERIERRIRSMPETHEL